MEGPTLRNVPAQQERVCNGCDYLKTSAMMRGHKSCTNNFTCTHPDFNNDRPLMSNTPGRVIHFNIEGNCDTPQWCPFLNKQKH